MKIDYQKIGLFLILGILVVGTSQILDSYSESKSIEAIIDLEPYDDDQITINVRFIDVIGQHINHVNYDITAKHNDVTVLEETNAHQHEGLGQHITMPLDIKSNPNDAIGIEIIFRGIGIDEPYGGPIGKVYEFTKSIESKSNSDFVVKTDKVNYESGNTVKISGKIDLDDSPSYLIGIKISVQSPDGNLVTSKQLNPDSDGTFEISFIAGGPQMDVDGKYLVEATNTKSKQKTSTTFDYVKKIPKEPIVITSNTSKQIPQDKLRNYGMSNLEVLVYTDSIFYTEDQIGHAYGKVGESLLDWPITIKILDPNNEPVLVTQPRLDNNDMFETSFTVGGTLWKEFGTYTVTAQANRYQDTWEIKYYDKEVEERMTTGLLQKQEEKGDTYNEIEQLKQENMELKDQVKVLGSEIESLQDKINDLNEIIRLQLKVIYDWIRTR